VQSTQNENLDSERLLSQWRWLCPQALTVIDRNLFGDLFLSDAMGRVHMLDVGGGEFSLVAESISEFTERARTPEMQQKWFQESAAKQAGDRGLVPGLGQCIGFSTPVVFAEGGGLDSAYIADLYEHVGFLGDIHRQIAGLPDGSKVRFIVKNPPGKP
jgi:hypothetical protein